MFPNFFGAQLLPQTELTLNLLHQSKISPSMSDWEHYHGTFNYNATPINPMGCPVITHNKPNTCKSWDFYGCKGFNVVPALNHCCCFHLVSATTKSVLFSEMVDFMHDYLNQPTVMEVDCIVDALNFLSSAFKDTSAILHKKQLT